MRHCFIAFLLCQGLCASLQAQTPTFASFKSYLIDQGALTLAVADFNNDGKTDAAIGFETGHLAVALGLGGGEFAPLIRTVVPGGAVDLAVADFDRDGKQDLMTVNKDGLQVLFYRGAGNGSFALAASRNVSAGRPDRLGIADFDRDGVLDVAVATSVLGSNVWVYFGVSSGPGNYGFSSTRSVQMDVQQPKEILTTDIDADGDADIVTNFTVLFGDGAGNFISSGPNVFGFPSNAGSPHAFATGDFNSDEAPDLAFGLTSSTPAERAIVIFHQQKTAGQPNGLFSLAQDIRNIAGSINHISVGLVDGVDPSDLVVTLNGNRHLTLDLEGEGFQVYHGLTNGTFRPGRRFFSGQDPIDAALLDLDANGNNDMLLVNAGIFTRTMVILKGDGAGNFDVPPSFGLDSSPGGLATDDLNGDSNLDVVVSGHFGRLRSAVMFLYGDGRGNLTPGEFIPTQDGYRPNRLLVGDLQGDGGPEVALAHQQSYNYDFRTVLALFPNAPGRKLPVFGPEMVVYPHIEANEESWPRVTDAALGDFNSDGITDLAVYRSAHLQTELFFGNGRGGFTPRSLVSSGADSTGMITADCNCDGISDVIQPNHGSDNLAVLASDGNGGLVQRPYFYGVEIRPEGAAAADFNLDGLLDVAVANARTGSVSILINQTGCLRGTVKLTPSTIVLSKVIPKQDEVKAHIRLPDGFQPSNVISGSIRLNGLSPVSVRIHSTHIEATFDITLVIALIPDAGKRTYANFRLTAQLTNGQNFVGTDLIRIAAK